MYTFLYADDTVLVSESEADLQLMVSALEEYCKTWQLNVNIDKTKIVVFSKGKIRKLPIILYDGEAIEVEHSYTYLGISFNYNGNFTLAIKKQVSQAKRALFALLAKGRKLKLPIDILCHLFDVCVVPILLYGSEIWGFSNLVEIEKVQTFFCKYVLRLNSRTANCMALGELGRLKLECLVKQRMVNFWARLSTGKTSKISYHFLQILEQKDVERTHKSSWLSYIKDTLQKCELDYLYTTDPFTLSPNNIKAMVKCKTMDIEKHRWVSQVEESGHCLNYRLFKENLNIETYLTCLNDKDRISLCRFRCSNHNLPIMEGRYNGVDRNSRVCTLCNLNDLGDEFHYIMKCPAFENERSLYINPEYYYRPDVLKFGYLFSSENVVILQKLAKFCNIIMERFKSNRRPTKKKKQRKKKMKG